MATEKSSNPLPPPSSSGRHVSPSPQGLRHRPLGRAATLGDIHPSMIRRRSSFLSETLSEARKSLRSSTDDLFLPKTKDEDEIQLQEDNSHWQSLPLGLALLPALGGLFFKDGSAFVTDITLLALAAIFMNWALRMPWDWYRSSQTSVIPDSPTPSVIGPIDEAEEATLAGSTESDPPKRSETQRASSFQALPNTQRSAAQNELRRYELIALFCCFVFPLLAAWLLHGIRSQLTRPSEGLVSNYNLTIFILVAEIRPISHLIKMIQRRTLFLQRRINAEILLEPKRKESQQILDLSGRLDELESHIANRISGTEKSEQEPAEELATKASQLATSDVKKTVQPELDALNRAMRRYEKRTTISAVQIESRLQELEAKLNDVVSLAAAVQRSTERQPKNYVQILTNWLCAMVVLPVQYASHLLSIPGRVASAAIAFPKRYFTKSRKAQPIRDGKQSKRSGAARSHEREKRARGTT